MFLFCYNNYMVIYMLESIKDNSIVITTNNIKNNILLSMSKNKIIKNIKFMNILEFKNNYYGTIDNNAIYYVMKKYSYSYDVTKNYLNNIFYKYDVLTSLYNDLLDNNLLVFNKHFKNELINKNIYVIGYDDIDTYLKSDLLNLNAIFLNNYENNNYIHDVLEFNSQSEEINYIAIDIINNHINELNKTYLVNVSTSYETELKRIFNLYNIPININSKESIYSLFDIQLFINNLKDTYDLVSSIELIKDNNIKNKVIDIINKYDIDNVDDIFINIIINDIKHTYKDNDIYDNAINVISFDDMIDLNSNYYILNFNQGVIPKVFHDDDLISDEIKKKLGINTSLDKVLNYKNKIINILNNYKNLTITYKLKDNYSEYMKSPLIDELNLNILKVNNNDYKYSNNYNRLVLGEYLDEYFKFNILNDNLSNLYATYNDINYLTYNNDFKTVDYNLLKEYLNNKINLSYSSLNNYFHCAFKYYINNILKLDKFEDTFQTLIGNLYHFVLYKMYEDNFELKACYYEFLKDKVLSNKERFFLSKLYIELESIVEVIKYQDSKSDFKNVLTEKYVSIDKSTDININFVGFIDKIKYTEINNTKYISIIDYKTGSVDTSLDNINYGFNLQLPIYIYLIKSVDNQSRIVGFYLQKILNNKKINTDNLKQDLYKDLKLIGYTIDDEEIISKFDHTYENSEVISSLKLTSKGFAKYSKLIKEEDINKIIEIVNNHINEVISKIKSGDFKINPKRINNELIGCKFCKYKDLCFKKEENIIDLKHTSIISILGGEDDGMD